MAVEVARLESWLVAHTRDFDRSMDKSESRMQSAGKTAGKVGLAIAGGLAFGIERSVKAAMDAQVSQSRLEIAFKNSGLSAARYAGQVNILEASGRKLGFTDEQTKNALGSLLIATKSMAGASRDLSVAQDVARFKHVDLTAATKMLTMAMAGSQRATKQLGIDVPKVTSAQDALKASSENLTTAQGIADLAAAKLIDKHRTESLVIDTVRQKLGGQADAYSKTAAGGMEQFRAQLDHLEVSMGTGLLPILARVASAVSAGTAYFSKHATMAKILVGALGVLATALIAARAAQILMNLAVLANPYVAAIAAVVAAGIAIYVFRDKLMNVFNWIKDHWPLITAILAGPIGIAVLQIVKHRDQIANAFTALPGMIGNAIGGAIGVLKNKLADIFDWHRIVKWIKDALGFHSPSPFFMSIGHDIVDSMARGVGNSAGILKDAVFRLAESLPGRALGAVGGAIGAIPGAKGTIVGQGAGSGIHASPAVAKQYAITQLKNYGWGPSEMTPLYKLWNQESGWRWNALNGNMATGAYGIPQSHPPNKLAAAGRDWVTNAFTQINWGLSYIKSKYGSPSRAWAQDVAGGLKGYATGGIVPGSIGVPQLAVVHGGETITPPGVGNNIIHNHNYNGPVVQDAAFITYLRNLETKYRRQNGRPAFGGA